MADCCPLHISNIQPSETAALFLFTCLIYLLMLATLTMMFLLSASLCLIFTRVVYLVLISHLAHSNTLLLIAGSLNLCLKYFKSVSVSIESPALELCFVLRIRFQNFLLFYFSFPNTLFLLEWLFFEI